MSLEMIVSLFAALGVGGLLGAFLNRYFEQQKQTNEHDIKIFRQSDEILNEKRLMASILDFQLLGAHRIDVEDFRILINWCDYTEQTGNKFLNRKIQIESEKLYKELCLLIKFIDKNFEELEMQNPHNTNIYLKPDLDSDRVWDEEDINRERVIKYQQYSKDLKTLATGVIKAYPKYRLAIKENLKI